MELEQVRFEDFEQVSLDEALIHIPGWTSHSERRFNKWVLRDLYAGEGEIVDLMKSPRVGQSIAQAFFPALLPGRSLLVHQDFKHYHTHWIHVMMFRLREHFAPGFDIPSSSSYVFRPVSPIDAEAIDAACDYTTLGPDEIDAVFEHSESLLGSGRRRWKVRAAKTMALLYLRESAPNTAEAGALLERARQVYAEIPVDIRRDGEDDRFHEEARKHL